ncbi:MAG: ChbG/HpnK family deacetylase [Acidobacteriota bacterium]|nr:ChbG/HpnK family deacetylase [Acidobacteriota bacterium]
MSKKLIINADDYGICREANRAIENLITTGRLLNVSVLVNSWFYEEAAEFLSNRADCSIGVHLNVVEGVALTPTNKVKILLDAHGQFADLSQILLRWMRAPFAVSKAVEAEWRAQIELLLKSGLTISHADSHRHIHAFPPFWKITTNLCREYGIPAVRLPSERNSLPFRRFSAIALTHAANVSETFVARKNLTVNQYFLGFKRAGSYGENELIFDLKNLQDGVTELCVHPSICDGVPYPNMRGALEYEALSSRKLSEQIAESEIELTTWAEFAKAEMSRN